MRRAMKKRKRKQTEHENSYAKVLSANRIDKYKYIVETWATRGRTPKEFFIFISSLCKLTISLVQLVNKKLVDPNSFNDSRVIPSRDSLE